MNEFKTVNLGRCTKCQNRLAVVQRTKFRMAGEAKILLDEDGKDLRQDPGGRLSGRPAREWVVSCSDCGKDARDHPHQKVLDEQMKKAKEQQPPPPAFMDHRYVELNGMDVVERRLAAIEAAQTLLVDRLSDRIDEQARRLDSLQDALAAVTENGKRPRKVPA